FGVGRDLSRQAWQGVFRQMMGLDLIRPDPERHGGLRMTEAAHPILRGEETITLRRDMLTGKTRRPAARALVSDEDAPLLSALKAKRRALAEAAKVPAYIVFNDRTLIEMAEQRPATLDAMAGITGVGAKKLEQYGTAFLEVITGEAEVMHPRRRKMAGQETGAIYDRLLEVQADLARGEMGIDKPLSCPASLLAKVAAMRPRDFADMARLLGDKRAERFGAAFLDVLQTAD
ncbi:MAG: HRDC domain-containing protein, partial [Rhodobacteraceae bacterium]|nr:HRDC domain-containing protein [Paracoccaceae bacterium]